MRLITKLEKSREFWFLVILSFIFFLFRLPSLFEPYWYGDEGIYQAIGVTLRNGGTIYQDAFDNKPPLLFVIYNLLNGEQYLLRLASLVFGTASVWTFFLLVKKLFSENRSGKITYTVTAIFAILFGLPIIEGNIANSENFMLLPIIMSALLILYSLSEKTEDRRNVLLLSSGVILSLAFLTKIVAIFDMLAFLSFLTIFHLKKSGGLEIRKIYFFLVGFILPVFITSIYFLLTANFKNFMDASLFSNISYVGLGNSLLIPQGLLFVKAGVLGLFLYIIFRKRKELDSASLFVLVWFIFSLFNSFFSQRPYIHYLLVFLPSFCLFIGLLLWNKKLRRTLSVAFIFTLVIVLSNFPLHYEYKTVGYYNNFLDFVGGKKPINDYVRFFDKRAVTDYKIASFINSNTTDADSIYLWGNNAQVYKMTNKIPPHRYTVLYHVTSYSDGPSLVTDSLTSKKPKFIVIMQDKELLPFSLFNYRERIKIDNALIYERIN